MRIVNTVKEMQELSGNIGFVPTMGFLHEGHLSLVRKAKEQCDKVVVSIFVNPTQFGAGEDFEDYPRDFERDKAMLEKAGVDILFYPSVEEIYPQGMCIARSVSLHVPLHIPSLVQYSCALEDYTWRYAHTPQGRKEKADFPSFEKLANKLCGISRPGHFEGVCVVVKRLFDIVKPSKAYFGLKDYQQYLIIKGMVDELCLGIDVIGCPTVRENGGLAMSSRNCYLNETEREDALSLYQSLLMAKKEIDVEKMKKLIRTNLKVTKIDYVEVVDSNTLEQINEIKKDTLVVLAVFIGKTRLIDNLLI